MGPAACLLMLFVGLSAEIQTGCSLLWWSGLLAQPAVESRTRDGAVKHSGCVAAERCTGCNSGCANPTFKHASRPLPAAAHAQPATLSPYGKACAVHCCP